MSDLLLWVRLMLFGQKMGFETLTPQDLAELEIWEKGVKINESNKKQEPVGSDSEYSDRDSA